MPFNGDRARAFRVYHTCTTILQRELDVEPSADDYNSRFSPGWAG
jgi:hypothetical protein